MENKIEKECGASPFVRPHGSIPLALRQGAHDLLKKTPGTFYLSCHDT
jgi:hypothetical protein